MRKIDGKLKKVLLIEAASSHDECLYTQVEALKSAGVEVQLAVDEQVANRIQVSDAQIHIVRTRASSNRDIVRAVSKLIKEAKPDVVVFNTAQGRFVRDLALRFLFHKVRFVGIIHTTRKFKGSFTQKIINLKIKDYLFLARFLLDQCKQNSSLRMDYFYPLAFPGKKQSKEPFPKKGIAIIGGVEERRKDLNGLLEMMQQEGCSDYHFVFLGKSDRTKPEVQHFCEKLETLSLTNRVSLFEDFVSHDAFNAELAQVDFILPLVHAGTPSAEQYFSNQIPGAMNVALAFKIPLLIEENYSHISELQEAAYYYKQDEFAAFLAQLTAMQYEQKVEAMKSNTDFQLESQGLRYLSFLRGENN